MNYYSNAVVVSEHGQILAQYSGRFAPTDIASLQSSIDNSSRLLVDVEVPPGRCRYDFVTGLFSLIDEPPSNHHSFDYILNTWVNVQSIDEVKVQRWEYIKQQRNILEFAGFSFEGNVYDSDQISQGRIMGAAFAGVDQVWTLADNSTIELTALQLQQLYAALQAHIASVHERGRIARKLINEALTIEQIESITF